MLASILIISSLLVTNNVNVENVVSVENDSAQVSVRTNTQNESVNEQIRVRVTSESQNREALMYEYRRGVEEAQMLREEKREEFRQRLLEIRDERKRALFENLNTNINDLNARWVERLKAVLDRLSEIADKIEARAQEDGVSDNSDFKNALDNVRAKIFESYNMVNEQASKVYTLEVTDENSLGRSVSGTLSELRADFEPIRESVSLAKDALRGLFQILATLLGENTE